MKVSKSLSLIVAAMLMSSNAAFAGFGDAVVGGIVGGAVGSVITNEVYNKNNNQQSSQQQPRESREYYGESRVQAQALTDERHIQMALSSLGFYHGRIDGQVNSYETRAAIKEMNMAYEISQNASLNPEAKDTLIFLGTLFEFDHYLSAGENDTRTKNKKLQTALKLHGYYQGGIDGAIGSGTRGSILEYKTNLGLSANSSLDFEEEYQLINSAREKNDKNIEDSIASLKGMGKPAPAPQDGKVIEIQQSSTTTVAPTH